MFLCKGCIAKTMQHNTPSKVSSETKKKRTQQQNNRTEHRLRYPLIPLPLQRYTQKQQQKPLFPSPPPPPGPSRRNRRAPEACVQDSLSQHISYFIIIRRITFLASLFSLLLTYNFLPSLRSLSVLSLRFCVTTPVRSSQGVGTGARSGEGRTWCAPKEGGLSYSSWPP